MSDPVIAYLTGEYPRVSHTFIEREIRGVRAQGLRVLPCSIRRTDAAEQTGAEERAAAAETFYVLAATRNPLRLVTAHLRLAARAPRRYAAALRLALRSGAPGWRARLFQAFYFAEAGVLGDHLLRRGVRHLHNHFADSSCSVAMLTAEMTGIPFSFTMHGPTEFFAADRWRLDLKVARAAFVACISRFCRSQLMLFSDPADWPKLRIVHCGVDPARYTGGGHPGTTPPRVIYVGRLAAVKGVRVLIEALARAADAAIEVTLVGDGSERAALEAAVAERRLTDRVRFTGYLSQDRVAAALRDADILVLPSFAEGVPIVLMEAMASGIPVIATRVGGVAELVEDGRSGLLVAPGDPRGLAHALARLAGDPALRRSMGAAGRARVAADFTATGQCARLAALFRHGPGGYDA